MVKFTERVRDITLINLTYHKVKKLPKPDSKGDILSRNNGGKTLEKNI